MDEMTFTFIGIVVLGILGIVQAVRRRWQASLILFLVAANIFMLLMYTHTNSMLRARLAGVAKENEQLRQRIEELEGQASNKAVELTGSAPRPP